MPLIIKITLRNCDCIPERRVETTLSDGTVITAEALGEGFQQYGGTTMQMWLTLPVVRHYLSWLHGAKLPKPMRHKTEIKD